MIPRPEDVDLEVLSRRYGRPREYFVRLQQSPDTFEYFAEQVRSKRKRGEVTLVIWLGGKLLLHTKDFYPVGTYRLLSGGIEWAESADAAAVRETGEETGLRGSVRRFLGLVRYELVRRDTGVVLPYPSYLLEMEIGDGEPAPPGDEERITAFRSIAPEALAEIADSLRALTGKWADWGEFRAVTHSLLHELLSTGRNYA